MQTIVPYLRKVLTNVYDDRETKALIRLLLEEVADLPLARQLLHPDTEIPPHCRQRLTEMAVRMAAGEPVQYVLGYEIFAGRKFAVNSKTLIPRPETAELTDWILQENSLKETAAAKFPAPTRLLDAGTGSGCIAITLAAACPACDAVAIDISEGAIETARANAEKIGVRTITFLQKDLLQEAGSGQQISGRNPWKEAQPPAFDLIVSNPPYITKSEAASMARNVLDYEPHSALFVPDEDPLLFYRNIARYGHTHLLPGGRLYFEINARFGREMIDLLKKEGYERIVLRQDLSGRDRMIRAIRPSGETADR